MPTAEATRPSKAKPANTREQTRAERISDGGGDPLLPEIAECAYLCKRFISMRMVQPGAFGVVSISAAELHSAARIYGWHMTPWEASALRAMSDAYVNARADGATPSCPPPYGEQAKAFDRQAVADRLRNSFAAMMRKQRGRKRGGNDGR